MIVYNKLGYQIKRFEKEDGIELFAYMIKNRMQNKTTDPNEVSAYSKRRKTLKFEVNEALNSKNNFPFGIYKNDKLVGICLSYITNEFNGYPVLKYIHIEDDYMDTLVPYVFFNFLMNIIYKDQHIKIKNGSLTKYGSIVRELPREIGFSIFNERFKNNIKNYFKDK